MTHLKHLWMLNIAKLSASRSVTGVVRKKPGWWWGRCKAATPALTASRTGAAPWHWTRPDLCGLPDSYCLVGYWTVRHFPLQPGSQTQLSTESQQSLTLNQNLIEQFGNLRYLSVLQQSVNLFFWNWSEFLFCSNNISRKMFHRAGYLLDVCFRISTPRNCWRFVYHL